ncbi:unnamed protein product [Cuscuta epithymum]|uniref:Uncharacterized protein n=1 Tax=Cuscuta epithymum TaxID=186058 RepID=A0AAV0C853_9ASTE|nr:unnamed protein product [Cuscuta epithymum]CAH9135014.1 unnamed protein product [Cuscuta epithymum]
MKGVKETAGNIGASAVSGMEKTKAVLQEKVERMTAHDPLEKEMATQKKEERINQAELEKREKLMAHKAEATTGVAAGKSYSYSTTGAAGHPTGAHQMSAMPGHGTGAPVGEVIEGVVESRPIGTAMPGTTRLEHHRS